MVGTLNPQWPQLLVNTRMRQLGIKLEELPSKTQQSSFFALIKERLNHQFSLRFRKACPSSVGPIGNPVGVYIREQDPILQGIELKDLADFVSAVQKVAFAPPAPRHH
jgi:hypothetical protein